VPSVRPAPPRARRFVFAAAAASAFSVAAVTLGGVGGLPATGTGDDRHGTAVTPVRGPAGGTQQSKPAQVPVDFPGLPVAATRSAAGPDNAAQAPYAGGSYGANAYGGGLYGTGSQAGNR
jgi:hypothetical protein